MSLQLQGYILHHTPTILSPHFLFFFFSCHMSCQLSCHVCGYVICSSLNTDSQCYDDVASHMKKLKIFFFSKNFNIFLLYLFLFFLKSFKIETHAKTSSWCPLCPTQTSPPCLLYFLSFWFAHYLLYLHPYLHQFTSLPFTFLLPMNFASLLIIHSFDKFNLRMQRLYSQALAIMLVVGSFSVLVMSIDNVC